MLLFLLRHGIAEDFGPDGTDASRPLSDRGVRRAEQASPGLAWMIREAAGREGEAGEPEIGLFSSPKIRAWQTAQLLGRCLETGVTLLETLADEEPARTLSWIQSASDKIPAAVLTGHQPQLGLLAGRLLLPKATSWMLDLKKGACALLKLSRRPRWEPAGSQASLEWLLPPRALRKLNAD